MAEETKVSAAGASASQAVKTGHRKEGVDNSISSNLAHKPIDSSPSSSFPKPRLLLDTERIIPQQLKYEIFRNCYPVDHRNHAYGHTEGTLADMDGSIVYRNHARWVLESNVMSDDSEDGKDDFMDPPGATPSIPHNISQGNPLREPRGPPAQLATCPITRDSWDDMFFLGDSDSSEYFVEDPSVSSNDDYFPIISGAELERVLEEAKGTIQFHKWQNAPPGEHQKEFKTLVKLHRFARESEARNQVRWRSREKAEKREKDKSIPVPNVKPANDLSERPNLAPSSPGDGVSFPGAPSPDNATIKPKPAPPITTVPKKKAFRNPKPEPQPATGETEYHYITADDIKFLRKLKKQFEESEFVPQSQERTETFLPSRTTLDKNPGKGPQEYSPRVVTMSPEKSLRDILRVAKPPPGISYRTEYESWFPEGQFGEQADGHPEQSQANYDGPIPKMHHLTDPFGDVSFHPRSVDYHPFFQAVKSSAFQKLVISTGIFWNLGANISLSGFWVTENLFITTLNFHPWASSTTTESLQDQIEDFKLRNNEIDIFVSNNSINWLGPNGDPGAIKVLLRAWDTSARIAIFQPEDKDKASANFTGIDMLIEEDAAYGYNGVHVATVGYNPLDPVGGDPLGLKLLVPSHRSVTFGEIAISEGCRGSTAQSPQIFARLDPGVSHGSYGRMCIIMEVTKNPGSIIGIGILESNFSRLSFS